MLLVESLSPDQQPPNQPPAQEEQPEEDNSGYENEDDLDTGEETGEEKNFQQPVVLPEMEPLKKFYLIQKIIELRARLQDQNIRNNDLDTVLKFVDNLSYMTLLNLTNAIIPDIEASLMRLNNNEKQN